MRLDKLITVAAVLVTFVTTGAFAQSEKEKKQAEVRTKAEQTLADFYKAEPKLKAEVGKAPGYAVFTTYGLSFILGGAGGKGLVHDNKTKKNTYMDLAQASAGVQIGAQEARYLFIFKDAKALQSFIDSGWEAGAEGGAGAKAGKTGGGGTGGQFTGGTVYSLTKTGFQAGGAVAGTKVWKDKELN
ncbi:MAG TPA: YSC84-related protein [Burkholderiales bacterium]|nr:YSC84-related protein [Burkholderiales bacterium]